MGHPVNADLTRCFLGLALPPAVRQSLAEIQGRWAPAGLPGAWVRVENFHITLHFLGALDPGQLATLDHFARTAFGRCHAVRLRVDGTGAFPSSQRPRVLWAGVSVEVGDIYALFEAAESGALAAGLPRERRRAHPHITLARLREVPAVVVAHQFLEGTRTQSTDAFNVASVALWQSTLRGAGAFYEQLREYPLS